MRALRRTQLRASAYMPNPHVFDMDLSQVAESQRITVWKQWSAETFRNMRVLDGPGGTLDGFIRGVRLGAGRLLKVRSAACCLVSKPTPVLTVVLQLSGASRFDQEMGSCALTAGDVGIFDGMLPFQQWVSNTSEIFLLQVQRTTAAARYPALLQSSGHSYPAFEPVATLMRGAVEAAFLAAAHLSDAQRERLCFTLFDLMALVSSDDPVRASRDQCRRQAALDEIENGLADSAFDARLLASRVGLSRRRLDEIFVQHFGRSVTAYIWERRLERAKDMLRDIHHSDRTITEIALDVGFEDMSHFSRAFKSRFGAAPSLWRTRLRQAAAS